MRQDLLIRIPKANLLESHSAPNYLSIVCQVQPKRFVEP
jgi:hypothetical protein